MKNAIVLALLLTGKAMGPLFAQETSLALKPGDKVPDIAFKPMNGLEEIRLAGLKGKLVILDFWGTGCIACIRSFPKMDSLQAKFGDKIKIILINPKFMNDDLKKVNRIFEVYQTRYGKPIGISSIFRDSLGEKYFPHFAHPHIVVIDQDGIFRTTSLSISEKDISMFLDKKDPGLIPKTEGITTSTQIKKFSVDTSGIIFKSMITGYLDSIPLQFDDEYRRIPTSPRTQVIRFINDPLMEILSHLYHYFPHKQNVVLEGISPGNIWHLDVSEPVNKWVSRCSFNYELIAPGLSKREICEQAKAEINKYFGIEVKVENRFINCWILRIDEAQQKDLLKKAKSIDKPKTLSEMVVTYFSDLDIPVIVESCTDLPLFQKFATDEYTFEGRIRTAEDLRRFADEYKLSLTKEAREKKVLVITKVN